MPLINQDKQIYEVEFLENNKVYVKGLDKIIRIFDDPRDLVGQTIGYLHVDSIAGIRHRDGLNYEYYYNCTCISEENGIVCGTKDVKRRSYLLQYKNDPELSCGCRLYKKYETDIIGNKYNDLTVIAFDHWEFNNEPKHQGTKRREYYYLCQCPHGRTQLAARDNLISHHIKGCKCTHVYHTDEIPQFKSMYHDMMTRCYNKNSIAYPNYGGRGITVCDSWHNFLNFKDDMYEAYEYHAKIHGVKDTTIERIDVNKGYSKDNCKFVTKQEQRYNKRNTHYYTFNGKQYTILDLLNNFCDKDMTYDNLKNRLHSKNFCIDDNIINEDIFINQQYRMKQQQKGLSFPLRIISDNSYYKNMKLPTTFDMHPYTDNIDIKEDNK